VKVPECVKCCVMVWHSFQLLTLLVFCLRSDVVCSCMCCSPRRMSCHALHVLPHLMLYVLLDTFSTSVDNSITPCCQ